MKDVDKDGNSKCSAEEMLGGMGCPSCGHVCVFKGKSPNWGAATPSHGNSELSREEGLLEASAHLTIMSALMMCIPNERGSWKTRNNR